MNMMKELLFGEYTKKYVAFVDVMGYSIAMENSKNPADLAIIQGLMSLYKDRGDEGKTLFVNLFSDSIYISSDDIREIIKFVSLLQIQLFAARGVEIDIKKREEKHGDVWLLRGGITFGDVYIVADKNGTVGILGPAVVRAYRLESEDAIYPRIIIDDEAINKMGNAQEYYINRSDDWYYVDYLRLFRDLENNDRNMDSFNADIKSWNRWCSSKVLQYSGLEKNDKLKNKYIYGWKNISISI